MGRAFAVLWLFLACALPYWYIWNGQYIFDDYQVIYTNLTLWKVNSLPDLFTFVLKPSKPVTNFFIALGHLISHKAWAQRMLSLGVHFLTTLLFYFMLLRTEMRSIAFFSALFFAILPIHSEAIAVGLFRMDILGTLFTLCAILSARQWFWRTLFLGLAMLSKEVFAIIAPVSLLLFYPDKLNRKFILSLLLACASWWGVLGFLLTKDAASQYPYGDVLGFHIFTWKDHLVLAARALIEGLYKTSLGYPLTTIRLADRYAIVHFRSLWIAPAVLGIFVAGIILISRSQMKSKPWLLSAAAAVLVYLVIPNMNIGSEHYWYFPAMGIMLLLTSQLWRLSSLPRFFGLAIYAFSLLLALEFRVFQLKTRLDLGLAEIRNHPESAAAWNNAAVALMETGRSDAYQSAQTFIQKARTLAPRYPNAMVTEYLYHLHQKDRLASQKSLEELKLLFARHPEKLKVYLDSFNLQYADAKR